MSICRAKSAQMLRQRRVRVPKVDRGVRSMLVVRRISVPLSQFFCGELSYFPLPCTDIGSRVTAAFLYIGDEIGGALCVLCFSFCL